MAESVVQLQKEIEHLKKALEHAMSGIAVTDRHGALTFVNEQWAWIHGYEQNILLGKSIGFFSQDYTVDGETSFVERVCREGIVAGEHEHTRKGGSTVWVLLKARSIKNKKDTSKVESIVWSILDISRQKEIENDLRQAQDRYDLAIKGSGAGIWDWDIVSGKEWRSPRFYTLLGYKDKEIKSSLKTFSDIVHPDDKDATFALVEAHFKHEKEFEIEYRLRTKGGEYKWFLGTGQAQWNEHDEAVRMVGTIIDIDHRKNVETQLLQSERQFRGAFDTSAIGMALVSPEGSFLKVNKALADIVGYTPDELTAKTFQEITHPDDLEIDLSHVKEMLAGERETYQMEKRYYHKNKYIVWILLAVSLVRDEEGNPVHFISQIQDITKRKEAEKKLEDKVLELERMNKAMIGRELRMQELKKEIKDLQKHNEGSA